MQVYLIKGNVRRLIKAEYLAQLIWRYGLVDSTRLGSTLYLANLGKGSRIHTLSIEA